MKLEEFLKDRYKPSTPILIEDIKELTGDKYTKQKMKRLCDVGKLRRYDTGIYFIPEISEFGIETTLNLYEVLKAKYLMHNGEKIGYYSGYVAMNMAGLTSQNPVVLEITTNRTASRTKEIVIRRRTIILKHPPTEVTTENADTLGALDIIENMDKYAESQGEEFSFMFQKYMQRKNVTAEKLLNYADYFPDYIYKNLFKGGLLNGIK